MIIAFGNLKGGVGKSTICLTLATYWASLGKDIHVIDTDMQQSLDMTRQEELEEDPSLVPPYPIEFNLLKNFVEEVPQRKNSDKILMVDLPGTYDLEVMKVLCYADFIIVPFLYEDWSLDATSKYASYIDIIDEEFPEMKGTAIFVPNHVNKSIGRKEDKEYWESWRQRIAEKVTLAPLVTYKACMQRHNTIIYSKEIRQCTEECFKFITDIVFKQPIN